MRTVTAMSPEAPRWLDAEERDIWLGWVFASRFLWEELERDLTREAGMSYGYYEILVMLSEAPNRTRRMSELADATQSSRSRLSHAIARLEEHGWVRRDRCGDDRRGAFAVLTDEGYAALEAAAPLHVESVRRHLFDQLTPEEQRELGEICDRLLEHFAPLLRERGDTRGDFLAEARQSRPRATDA